MATAGVDFFRVDRSGPTKRLLVVAGAFVTLGASAVGAHLVSRLRADVGHLISLGGGLVMLAGLVLGFGAMAMLLFENAYLLIREDGVLLHENGEETVVVWADLERADVDGAYVVVRRRDAPELRWFAGRPARTIVANLTEARRKALHGLLRSAPASPGSEPS